VKEIKFRGKKVSTKEWVYGSLVQSNHLGLRCYILKDVGGFSEQVIPETVGQLNNKLTYISNIDIYEGDVISHDLIEGMGEPYSSNHKSTITDNEALWYYYTNIKLIGNIHDSLAVTQAVP
jgi:hypothetical protein